MATECRHCEHFKRYVQYGVLGKCSEKKQEVHSRAKSCKLFDLKKEIERGNNGESK